MSCGDAYKHAQANLGTDTPEDMPIKTAQQRCPTCGQWVGGNHLCPEWTLKSPTAQSLTLVRRNSSNGGWYSREREGDRERPVAEDVDGLFLEIFGDFFMGPFGSQAAADEWVSEMGGEPAVVAAFAPHTLKRPWEHFPIHQDIVAEQAQQIMGTVADDSELVRVVEGCNAYLRRDGNSDAQWDARTVLPILNAIESRHGRLEQSPLSEDASRRLLVDIKSECEASLKTGQRKTYNTRFVRRLAMYGLGDTDFGWMPEAGRYAPPHHIPGATQARVSYDDPLGRFKAGEVGEILPNDFPEKYDYLIRFPGTVHIPDFLGEGPIDAVREYYFRRDEVVELEPVDEKTFWASRDAIINVLFGEGATIMPGDSSHRALLDKAAALAAVKVDGPPQGELRGMVETVFERMTEAQSPQSRLYFARQIDALVQGQPIFRAGGYGDGTVRSPGAILRFEAEELGNEAQLEAAARQFGVEPGEVCGHLDRRFRYAQWGATCEEALTNYAEGDTEAVEMMDIPADAQRIVDMPDGTLWAWQRFRE